MEGKLFILSPLLHLPSGIYPKAKAGTSWVSSSYPRRGDGTNGTIFYVNSCIMTTKRRFIKPESLLHIYEKGEKGRMLFYVPEDYILYFTLHSCVSRAREVRTVMFCLMPNHVHSAEMAENIRIISDTHRDIESRFATEYNLQHKRQGRLFKKSFGSAIKSIGKRIRENLCYIANNPVAGNISTGITDYRWNLLAFNGNSHPFSQDIKIPGRLRRSINLVNEMRRQEKPLGYGVQHTIFKDLNHQEREYLTDHIISIYNFVEYDTIAGYFGSFENAIITMEANSGSEYDIKEDWEDYSLYRTMTLICKGLDIDMDTVNFDTVKDSVLRDLAYRFRMAGASEMQIRKFLGRQDGTAFASFTAERTGY